jgi:hypothetical protein
MAASISVRQLSASWDPMWGQGLANFLTDLQAVSQIVKTRLLLNQGEWFADLSTGTPLFQSILGVPSTSQGVALLLRQRILGSAPPFVTGISNVTIAYGAAGRNYSFGATVQTVFGQIQLTIQPGPGTSAVVTTT